MRWSEAFLWVAYTILAVVIAYEIVDKIILINCF
jgi:hypothetical protein